MTFFVTHKDVYRFEIAISDFAGLAGQVLLGKVATYDRMRATVPFLLHSSLWARQSTAGLVTSGAARLCGCAGEGGQPGGALHTAGAGAWCRSTSLF